MKKNIIISSLLIAHNLSMSITTTVALQQAIKAQDFVVKTDNAITVFDGHGYDDVINVCRQMDPSLFEKEPNKYITTLEQKLSKVDTTLSGSTFAGVRILTNSSGQLVADIYWVGDSDISIYDSNGLRLFKTDTAKILDPEMEIIQVTDAHNLSVKGEKDMGVEIDHYWHFPKGEVMNMTEALGHQNVAYLGIHQHQIPVTSNLKIIIATDGLWDMTYDGDKSFLADPKNQAYELLQFALQRWSQEWTYNPNLPGEDKYFTKQKTMSPNEWDDIAIGVITISHN